MKFNDGLSSDPCVFCAIARGTAPASIVYEDEHTLSFVDLRQFSPGHMLVVPRRHLADVRELDEATGAALMVTVAKIARAIGKAFPNQGLSLWHSIGPAAFQEVPHLHIHVHPRVHGDGLLRVYPGRLPESGRPERDRYAALVRKQL